MPGNILTDRPPESLTINGRTYSINGDFKTCLLIMLAFEDNELAVLEKQFIMLDNLFNEQIPEEDAEEAIEQAVWFLDCGQRSEDAEDGKPSPRVYSFSKDDRLIYAAFRQTHGIDLVTADLHWWQFMSLFMDLGSETVFCSLVGLRKRVKTGRASKEERALALEMGSMFDVPEIDNHSLEEKERRRAFMDQYREARKRKDEERKKRT
ncbi:MAG: Gp15 family bacteriophage protein [Chloroflexota bacterium]|nr:Gp15 family bacteriophage protein [Chloroflexota bacterium]